MKRRLNRRLLIWLVLPTLVVGFGISWLHDLQVRRNAGALLERANRAEGRGDLGKAEEYLRLFLDYEPNHSSALSKYGLILASGARTVDERIRAVLTLEKAIGADPERRDVRRKLVDTDLGLMRFSDAQRHLKVLLGKQNPGEKGAGRKFTPEDGELESLLGQCAEGERDYASAALWYRDAIDHAPQQIDAYIRLADLLRNRLLDVSGADQVMDAHQVKHGVIAANGRMFRAYLARAVYRRKNEIEGADQDAARALELAPQEPEPRLTAAAFAFDRGDFDQARRYLRLGLELQPRDWRMSMTLGWLERKTGHLREAEACLRRGVESAAVQTARLQLLWALAEVIIDGGNWAEAKALRERLGNEGLQPVLLDYLDARIGVAEGKWFDAVKKLERLYPLLEGKTELASQADLLLGLCYERLGDVDRRYSALRRAVNLDPSDVAARLGLAAALESMGRLDEALAEYRRLNDQAPGARLGEARLLILRNLRRPAAARDWAAVEQALDKAARVLADSSEVILLRAEALVGSGQGERAGELLKKARDRQPARIELWIAMAELALRREMPGAAQTILEEARQRFGDRVELRLAAASRWAKRGGPEAARALAALEGDLDGFSSSDQERLLGGLADAFARMGDDASSSRLVNRLAQQRPFDFGLRFSQFELALKVGDEAAAKLIVAEMKALEDQLQTPQAKSGAFWQCAQGRFLLWKATRRGRAAIKREEIEQARVFLAEARSLRPSWALVPLSEAELDDLVDNTEGAIKGYQRAVDLGMHNWDILRRLVQLFYDRRRYEQAAELIRKLQEHGPIFVDPRFQRLAAEVSLRANDRARALDLAAKSIPAGSKDYRDHLWLGEMFWAAGELAKAEPELRRAVELSGGAPESLLALVQYLSRTGHRDQAKAVIEQAGSRLRGEDAPVTLARCHVELGDFGQARVQFRAAVASRPDDVAILRGAATFELATGQNRDAEAYLRRMMEVKIKPDDAAWARRLLAAVLAQKGEHRQWLEALKLVDLDADSAYQPTGDEPLEDLRSKAMVLALGKERAARRAAIRVLRQINQREIPVPDDEALLARLYEADGDWPMAHRQIRHLLASEGDNPLHLAQAARSLIHHGVIDEARTCLARLEQAAPGAAPIVELRARLLVARGSAREAASLLKRLIKEKPEQAGGAALLLEELGQTVAAEKFFRQRAAQSRPPEAILLLAGFLGRRNRVAEALKLCEQAWASCPPAAVAQVVVGILYGAPIDDAQCGRAAQMLETRLSERSTDAGLLFQLANIKCLQGLDREAETLYRKSIELDKSNSGPLANLAWLLARRDSNGPGALELIARAMLLDGPAPDLLDTRALAYLVLGHTELAIKDLEDAIAMGPSPLKRFHLAEAYLKAQRKREASAALGAAQAAGLVAEKLNPIERKPCLQLLEKLAQK
jgi:tetratricopeptide (TPR) repeat protein